jgi:O-antigen/teichoic acid export membrane protein
VDIAKFLQNLKHLTSATIVSSIALFLQVIIIARGLSISEFGVWGAITAYFSVIVSIIGFKVSDAYATTLAKSGVRSDKDRIMSILTTHVIGIELVSSIVAGLAGVILSTYIIDIFIDSYETIQYPVFIYFGILVFLNSLSNVFFCLGREVDKVKVLSRILALFNLLSLLIVSITYYFYTLSIINILYCFLFVRSIAFLTQLGFLYLWMSNFYSKKYFKQSLTRGVIEDNLISLFWKYILASYFYSTITGMVKNVDMMVIGFFSTDSDIGLYKVAKTLAAAAHQFISVLSQSMVKDFSRMIALEEYANIIQFIKKYSRVSIVICLLLFVLAIGISQEVINIIYNGKYNEASSIFLIMLFASLLSLVLVWGGTIIVAAAKFKIMLTTSTIVSTITIFLYYILTDFYGIYGTAIANASMWIMYSIVYMILSYRYLINPSYK